MISRKVSAIMMVFLFAFSAVNFAILPVSATVSGSIEYLRPNMVAPGGPIEVKADDLVISGGKAYFYISKDNDAEISSGDIQFASVDKDDLDESVTLFVPSNLAVYDEYYLKVVDVKGVGKECVVATDSFEVPEEYPTVTVDPTSGVVTDIPTLEGTDAEDYDTFELYWNDFQGGPDYATQDLDDGEFTVEEDDEWDPILPAFEILNGFEGTNHILVLFTDEDGDTLSTLVEFTLSADIAVDVLSVAAGSTEDQVFTISGTGFPTGTVDSDSITLTVKDFLTGSTVEIYDTLHDEVDVVEDEGLEGTLEIEVTVQDTMEAGSTTLTLKVDGATRTFSKDFFASEPTDVEDFTSIKYAKASKTEAQIGKKAKFFLINLPSDAAVVILMVGETVTKTIVDSVADVNGAFKVNYKFVDIPGGSYAIRASVTADGTTREKNILTFKILPKFVILDDQGREIEDSKVGNEIKLKGTGFPADATIKTVFFGTKEVDFDNVDTLDTGTFLIEEKEAGEALKVPHVSGGGQLVTVAVEGEDSEGDALKSEFSLKIKPKLLKEDEEDWDVGVLLGEDWEDFTATTTMFPGNPTKMVGYGFKAGEAVTVKLYDEDDELLGSAVVTDGATAETNGDLDLTCLLPAVKAIYPAGKENVYLKAEGATSGNNAKITGLDIAASDDDEAKLIFGMNPDGELKLKKKVGDTVRVIGCGFRTKSLTLIIDEIDEEVKDVTATYGAFDTTIVLPEMEGEKDGLEYTLVEDETGTETTFLLKPKLTLTPNKGFPDDAFTVYGTGFQDGTDVDINWLGTAEEENLDTVDGDDVEDGSFSMEFTVPAAVAQSYKVLGVVEDEEWASASYLVQDEFDIEMNKTLKEILSKLGALDVAAINAAINSLKTDVSTLKTDVTTAKSEATAAKTAAAAAQASADAAKTTAAAAQASADAAKTAASDAKTAATDAKTAGSAAKTAADSAKAAVDGLMGLVYAAIGASIVAALAAIVAVIQLQRKVAG